MMHRRSLKIIVALLTSVSIFGVSNPAGAATSTSSGDAIVSKVFKTNDPQNAYQKLNKSQKQAFDKTMKVANVEVTMTPTRRASQPVTPGMVRAAAYNGCWSLSITGRAKNSVGKVLYTYWQTTAICANNNRVTAVWMDNAGGETSTPGWRIERGPDLTTRNVGWEGRGIAQYHFVLGVGGYDIQHPTNCLQGRLNGSTAYMYGSSSSCNPN